MAKIRTYRCKPFSAGVSREITDPLGMEFPKAYKNRDDIVTLALAVKEHLTACQRVNAKRLVYPDGIDALALHESYTRITYVVRT